MDIRGILAIVLVLPSIPPLAAQPMNCVRGAAAPGYTLRSEGLSELISDLVFSCTGGEPTPVGQPVPRANVFIQLNTNAGTVLLPNGGADAFLTIDNPSPANQVVQSHTDEASLTGVGGEGIFYDVPGSQVNMGQRVPNVFQGQMNGRNTIVWLGVPIDPPGSNGQRIIRVKNVRADANLLARSGISSLTVTANSPELGINNVTYNYGPITNALAYLGFDQNSQFSTQVNNAGIFYTDETLNENQPPISSAQRIWTIQVAEGGVDTFRTRYIAQGTIADPFPGPVEQQARVDALFPGSETGFVSVFHPIPNIPTGSYGTRIGFGFSGLPQGVEVFISEFNRSISASATVGAVIIKDCLGPAERAPASNGMVKLTINNGTGFVCAEIFRNSPMVRELFFFEGYYSFNPRVVSRPVPSLVTTTIFVVPTAFYTPNLFRPVNSVPLFGRSPNSFERSVESFSNGRFLNDSSAAAAIQVSRIPEFSTGTLNIILPKIAGTNIQLVPTNASLPVTITPVVNPPSAERQATAGWLTVTPSQGSAPLTLNIQGNPAGLAPGTYTGGVRIQTPPPSSISNLLPVSMVIPAPGPRTAANGVAGAADYFAGAVTAGQAIVVFGSGYGPPSLAGLALGGDGRVATQLGETRVLFDGRASPMIYAVNGQVSAFVPFAVAGQTNTVMTVEYRGVASPPVHLRVVEAIPGLFTANNSGSGQGAILNQNGSVNSASNPANPGEVIVLFGTGAGQTDPPGTDGRLAVAPLPVLRQPVQVLVDGEPVEVLYAGPAPGLAEGVLQVNARLSADTRRGRSAEVMVLVGEYRSQPGVTVAVSQ